MKSIMAEAETTKTKIYRAPSTPPRTTSQTLGDSSSRNTSEKPLVRTRETSERSATRPLGSSSWRPSPVQYVSTSRTPPKNPMQPSGAKQSPIRQTETSQIHSEKVPSTPSKSMMGPTFVPSKQPISRASSSPTIRRVP